MSGVGIGLRFPHLDELARRPGVVPWFELIADNLLGAEAPEHAKVEALRSDSPMAFHGVGLSLAGPAPLDAGYLTAIRELLDRYEANWYSEHLSWSSTTAIHFHELLPLPHTEEAVKHASERIARVQDAIGRRLVIENVSTYLQFAHAEMDEASFVAAVADAADCEILLDLQNVHVAACNHGIDPLAYLDEIPAARVREFHLAGGEEREGLLLDTHSRPVADAVWSLYGEALQRFGPLPTLVEWDHDLPDLDTLLGEATRASAMLQRAPA